MAYSYTLGPISDAAAEVSTTTVAAKRLTNQQYSHSSVGIGKGHPDLTILESKDRARSVVLCRRRIREPNAQNFETPTEMTEVLFALTRVACQSVTSTGSPGRRPACLEAESQGQNTPAPLITPVFRTWQIDAKGG